MPPRDEPPRFPDADTGEMFVAGEVFASRYRMIQCLGRGGMGDVWRAEDLVLHLHVALKVLHRVGLQARTAVLNEVRLARQITHPAICRVFDVGESAGQVFFTMELVEGEDLASVLRRIGRLPPEKASDIALQLCDGLAAAHAQHVLHRDLKPANILMDRSGRVRISDFGIAVPRARADCSLPAGTPGYMAPEQMTPGAVLTEQTDLYALGLVLFELASGRRPFPEIEMRREPPPLAAVAPDVDPALAGAVQWALALDPARRPPSAQAMADRLRSRRPQPDAGLPPAIPRRRAWLAAGTVAAIALGVAAVWLRSGPASTTTALTERDTIVLAEFSNSTGEPVFDRTLKVALAVALEQSPFIKVFPDEQVADALRLMKQPEGTLLTRGLAREVARREGLKAYLSGSIAGLGTHYVIALEAVDAVGGDAMARAQVEAETREQVLTSLGQAAASLRERLGESLASIRRFDVPLPQATTPSLDALHAYAQALDEGRVQVRLESIAPLRRAIDIDPEFALAYAMLSGAYANTDQPGMAPAYARRAFELRDRVSERERFFIGWRYYRDATFAVEQALALTRSWTETYPRESIAFNSLGLAQSSLGQYDASIDAFHQARRLDPKLFATYGNAAESALAANRLDEAEASLREADARGINVTAVRRVSFLLALMRGDAAGMERQLASASGVAESNTPSWRARAAVSAGRIDIAHEEFGRAVTTARGRGLLESAAQFAAEEAEAHAALGDCAVARSEGDRALAMSRDIFTMQRLARTFALCGERTRVSELGAALVSQFPEALLTHRVLLPIADAVLALNGGDTAGTAGALKRITPYENTPIGELWPWYLAGVAALRGGDAAAAARQFQQVIDHRGVRPTSVAYLLAKVGLARAARLAGETIEARSRYDAWLVPLASVRAPLVDAVRQERAGLD